MHRNRKPHLLVTFAIKYGIKLNGSHIMLISVIEKYMISCNIDIKFDKQYRVITLYIKYSSVQQTKL